MLNQVTTDHEIEIAAQILRDGGLVAFPTETVYGLGADASNPEAIRKIFVAKGRPADHPVIVHIADASELKHWAAQVPNSAWVLAEKFWPGPLTLVLKRAGRVSDLITGGQDTVGVRVPSHPLARQLLNAFGGGIAAPSANSFGRLSPTTARHVGEELGDAVELVLDGGPCAVGIESTIVDLSGAQPSILRPGAISAAQIEEALSVTLGVLSSMSPRAPGALATHYAPRTALVLTHDQDVESFIEGRVSGVAVLARRSRPRNSRAALWQVAPQSASEYAQHLYALLRRMDSAGCALIVVESPPDLPEWTAVRDRLQRAAATAHAQVVSSGLPRRATGN